MGKTTVPFIKKRAKDSIIQVEKIVDELLMEIGNYE